MKELCEEESIQYIKDYLVERDISLEQLSHREHKLERENLVKELISKSDMSLRKIAELTGINRETVRKISMSKEERNRYRDGC